MEVCPCSPDIGDCGRCGKRYPKDTMTDLGKPPKSKPIVPGSEVALRAFDEKFEEGDIDKAEKFWNMSQNLKKFEEKRTAAVKQSGVASKMAYGTYRRNVPKLQGGKTRRNTSTGGDIVSHLLTIRNQVKLYHWQTGSFARHKATDDLTAALDTNIDAFVESYMGRYGRPKVSGSIKLHNFSESAARAFVAKQTKYLSTELPKKIKTTDTDLLNLRDTILGDLTKVLYLFTLA
jgi:hypothetical protein